MSLWRFCSSSLNVLEICVQCAKTRVCRKKWVPPQCDQGIRLTESLCSPKLKVFLITCPGRQGCPRGGLTALFHQLHCLVLPDSPIPTHLWFLYCGFPLFVSSFQINPCWQLRGFTFWSFSMSQTPPFFLKPHTKIHGYILTRLAKAQCVPWRVTGHQTVTGHQSPCPCFSVWPNVGEWQMVVKCTWAPKGWESVL